MAKIEIELTEGQLEKVKELEAHDITVGDAIDKLFEIREKVLPEIEAMDEADIGIFEKIKEATLDVENKAEILDENYGDAEKSYEMKVQDIKHKVSWAKDFFNF